MFTSQQRFLTNQLRPQITHVMLPGKDRGIGPFWMATNLPCRSPHLTTCAVSCNRPLSLWNLKVLAERNRQRSHRCHRRYCRRRATVGRRATQACRSELRTVCAALAAGRSSAFFPTVCNAGQVSAGPGEPLRPTVRQLLDAPRTQQNLNTTRTLLSL
jgi:hypothetical protein